ncbi:hypothetical protein ACFXG4_40035 [Nocardia sp. NPDC059246]|uniref:hypothetical protein n=1 Tax=unclassified Nocardia TaxID=2637762 RepID=UPI003690667C
MTWAVLIALVALVASNAWSLISLRRATSDKADTKSERLRAAVAEVAHYVNAWTTTSTRYTYLLSREPIPGGSGPSSEAVAELRELATRQLGALSDLNRTLLATRLLVAETAPEYGPERRGSVLNSTTSGEQPMLRPINTPAHLIELGRHVDLTVQLLDVIDRAVEQNATQMTRTAFAVEFAEHRGKIRAAADELVKSQLPTTQRAPLGRTRR